MTVIVISPHLDDAVFGCGEYMAANAGAVCVTVFAGTPPQGYAKLNAWDTACGFAPGENVMAWRRKEDRKALAQLGAQAVHMDWLQGSYLNGAKGTRQRTHPYQAKEIAETISVVLEPLLGAEPHSQVVAPLGLVHSDHKRVHNACLLLLGTAIRPEQMLWYEESPYRAMRNSLAARLRQLGNGGHQAAIMGTSAGTGQPYIAKLLAIQCYASQIKGLRAQLGNFTGARNLAGQPDTELLLADTVQRERYWHIAPPA